jgi:thymidylate kinase
MAQQKPDLIIRLNVDLETAFARKSDHPRAELIDKIEKMPKIDYNGSRIFEIDAALPYGEVLETALRTIHSLMP